MKKVIMAYYTPMTLNDFGIVHNMNKFIDVLSQKSTLINANDDYLSLQEKTSLNLIDSHWCNQYFGGSVFDPIKSNGSPLKIARTSNE